MVESKLLEEALSSIIYENRSYFSAGAVREFLQRLSAQKKFLADISVSDNCSVKIAACGFDTVLNEFAFVLDSLREFYASRIELGNATYVISSALKNQLIDLNEAGVPLPQWVLPIQMPVKVLGFMYEEEKIDLVCIVYNDLVQQIVSSLPLTVPTEALSALTKDFFKKNSNIPVISIGPRRRAIIQQPLIKSTKDNREMLVEKYSQLMAIYLEYLDETIGHGEAMTLVKKCYDSVSKKYGNLSELGITKSIFKGVFWARVPTGIMGFDELVEGGLPKKSAVILQGPLGSEKMMIALQFTASGLLNGNSAVVVLSNTSVEEFRNFLTRFNIDARLLEESKKLCYVDCYSWRIKAVNDYVEEFPVIRVSRDLSSVSVGIQKAMQWLKNTPVKRAYIDLLSPFLKHFDFNSVYEFTQILNARLKDADFTSVFIMESGIQGADSTSIQEIFDGVIDIRVNVEGDDIKKTIGILTMVDTVFTPKYHPLEITPGGVIVMSK